MKDVATGRLPLWLRTDGEAVHAQLTRRAGGNGARFYVWDAALMLALGCERLAVQPEREAEVVPQAHNLTAWLCTQLPSPPITQETPRPDLAMIGPRRDPLALRAWLLARAHALVGLLTAPENADALTLLYDLAAEVQHVAALIAPWDRQAPGLRLLDTIREAEPPD
ncbi:MAG TPA: hypothetical protein VFQ85_05565 [Mycobacteriales bacterium]|jgi:hypothetical protein|nr:hypothetical protein [Mycobacteriales bacterium]